MRLLPKVFLLVLAAASSLAAGTPAIQAFDVPRINGIVIDGSTDDWQDRGLLVAIVTDPEGRLLPAADFDARFRLGWNKAGLLVLATVRDDVPAEGAELTRLWQLDCVEMFAAQSVGSSNRFHVVVAPGADPAFGESRGTVYDHRPEFLRKREITATWAATVVDGGYVVEALLPWENLGIQPDVGVELAFQFSASDHDGGGGGDPIRVAWYPSDRSHRDARAMHPVRLARNPGPPVLLAADREIGVGRATVVVRGAREALGREVTLRSGGETLETRRLTQSEGRTGARFELPGPGDDGAWPRIEVESEGERVRRFAPLPMLETVLDRWIEAAGGRDVLELLTSRTYVGEYAVELGYRDPPRETGSLEIRAKVPGRWEMIVDDNDGIHRDACDGRTGWRRHPDGVERDDRLCASLTALFLDPQAPLRIRDYYPELVLRRVRALESGLAYMVEAVKPGAERRVLYFDVDSGLLVQVGGNRKLLDYHEVDGVMVPHRIEMSRKGGWAAYEFHSVTHGEPMDDTRFEMPGPDVP